MKISWDNPFVDSDSCDASLSGSDAVKFRLVHTCGVGNTAQMRYELFDRVLANFSQQQHSGNPVLIQSRFGRQGNFEMIESNFGSPGNLEVIARHGHRLAFFFRDSGPTFNWNGPFFM